MGGIFLSYRRSDSTIPASWLNTILARHFGGANVFLDRDPQGLQLGDEFDLELRARLRASDVVLAVVGPDWFVEDNTTARPRLFEEQDWVRQELALALAEGIRIVPVVVGAHPPGQAGWPPIQQLPPSLEPMVPMQAYRLSDEYFNRDAQDLVQRLRPLVPDYRSGLRRQYDYWRPRLPHLLLTTVLVMLGVFVGLRYFLPDGPAEQMAGEFNIAVSEIDDSLLDDTETGGEDVGMSIATAVESALEKDFSDNAEIWGPTDVEAVRGSTPKERRKQAYEIAVKQNVDVLIYGKVTSVGGGLVTVRFEITVRNSDERRAVDPTVLEGTLGTTKAMDARRVDGADEMQAQLATLSALDEILLALRALDRADPQEALVQLTQARETVAGSDSRVESLATLDALIGVAHLRLAEMGLSEQAVELGKEALTRSMQADPEFAFAQLWMLGARYLEAVGGDRDGLADLLAVVDESALLQLRDDVTAFRDSDVASGNQLNVLQARSLLGEITLIRHGLAIARGEASEHFLDEAEADFIVIEEAYQSPPAGLRPPELEILTTFARESRGLIAANRLDLTTALEHFESAREIAAPYSRVVNTARIGLTLMELDRICEGRAELLIAIEQSDAVVEPFLTGPSRDYIEAQLLATQTTPCIDET